MSIRTERVARLVQRDVAEILGTELAGEMRSLVTVTGVRMTGDLGIAYVHLSVLGAAAEQRQAALRHVQELAPAIRTALAGRIRHQLRSVPELKFFLDEALHQAQHMESVFERIRQERAGREGAEASPDKAAAADDERDG